MVKRKEIVPVKVGSHEVHPVKCELKTWEEVDKMYAELRKRYRVGGGDNLRAEMVGSIVGGRLTIVFNWEDM